MKSPGQRRRYALALCIGSLIAVLSAISSRAEDHIWVRYTDEGHDSLKQHRYADAEKCFRAALERAKQLDPKSGIIRDSYHDLAMLRYEQGRYPQAEPYFKSAIASYDSYLKDLSRDPNSKKQALQTDKERVKEMSSLADCYRAEGKYKQAEALYRSAMKDLEARGQQESVLFGSMLSELADVLSVENRYAEAEPLYKRSLPIFEHHNASAYLIDLYQDYEALLRVNNRNSEADQLEKKLEKAREQDHKAALEL